MQVLKERLTPSTRKTNKEEAGAGAQHREWKVERRQQRQSVLINEKPNKPRRQETRG